jgi:hypothetical protein
MNQSKAQDPRQRVKWIRSGAVDREKTLRQLILQHHHPELAQVSGHVLQVWHDGEVTTQKAGELLWQRTLHCLAPSILAHKGLWKLFPEQVSTGTFIFTDERGALEIRQFFGDLSDLLQVLQHSLTLYICEYYYPETPKSAFDYREI